MSQRLLLFYIMSHVSLMAFGQSAKKETIRLFFLGGQSNMEGHGLNIELPDSLTRPIENVYIFHGNPTPDENNKGGLGRWDNLKSGNGAGFTSDGINNKLAHKFGPELSFGSKLAALYPGEKLRLLNMPEVVLRLIAWQPENMVLGKWITKE